MCQNAIIYPNKGTETAEDVPETCLYVGLDIGSATVKLVVIDQAGGMLFARYQRHFSQVRATVAFLLREVRQTLYGRWRVTLTGSGAIDLARQVDLPFVQEVMAAASACVSVCHSAMWPSNWAARMPN